MDEDTIRWILTDTSVDPVSKVPVSTVVFMLYYGLELRHFLLNISKDIVENYNSELRDYGASSLYLAGSAAQGFYLNTNDFLDARDVDVVSVVKKDVRKECEFDRDQIYTVQTEEKDEDEANRQCKDVSKENTTTEAPPSYLNIETWDDTYPGYVLLRKCRKNELPVQTTLSHRYVSSAETAKSRTEYWNELQSVLADIFRSGIDDEWGKETLVFEDVELQGPAASSKFTNIFLDVQLNADLVFALPYPGWPELAKEWRDRKTVSGWPSEELKQDIVKSGCLIVPKGQKGSRTEDYEWRISFSLAELKLARSLNHVQRELVHVLKAFISDRHETGFTGIEAKLDSYFIINLLFAESELASTNEWTEKNLANIIFRILDKLERSIRSRNLPHYFIPKNNLLHRLTFPSVKLSEGEFTMGYFDEMMDVEEYLDFALYTVMRARYNPLNQILLLNKYVQLSGAIRMAVFEPLIAQAMTSCRVEGNMYLMTVLRLAKAHFFHLRFKEAHLYIEDTFKFYHALGRPELSEKVSGEIKILRIICAYLVGNYNTAMEMFEESEKRVHSTEDQYLKDYKEIYFVYFARTLLSVLRKSTVTENTQLLSRIEALLKKAIAEHVNSGGASTVPSLELVNYFMNLGRYQEADSILNKVKGPLGVEDSDGHDSIAENQDDQGEEKQEDCASANKIKPEIERLKDSKKPIAFKYLNADEDFGKTPDKAEAMDTFDQNFDENVYRSDPDNCGDKNLDMIAKNLCSEEQKEHLDHTKFEDHRDKPQLDRHANQDLLNKYALLEAFKKLGLHEHAENVLQKLEKKLLQKLYKENGVTMEALKHDYRLYMTYENVGSLPDDWQNPLSMFKEQIVFSTADERIIDNVLKYVITDYGCIKLTVHDAYFHYRIQLLKVDGKLPEALALIEHIQDQDLVVSHYRNMGEIEKADDAAFYARLDRDGGGRSVAETLKQWIEKLMEAARKYELRNVYLDSVFS